MFEKIHEAIIAMRLHQRSPEDVGIGVRFIDAFSQLVGRGDATMLGRMRETELGRRLLEERHSALALVVEREQLRALPEGTLGREYIRFVDEKTSITFGDHGLPQSHANPCRIRFDVDLVIRHFFPQ